MAMKAPKITIDPSALRKGIWGNTWKEWGLILLAFGVLYGILTGYLTGLLFAAKGIRQDDYRTMSGKYFGKFDRQLFTDTPQIIPSTDGTRNPHYFNRPDGCTEIEEEVPLPGFPNELINKTTGILACSNSDKQWRWTVYPWVLETNGLGAYPGCSNTSGAATTGYTYLSDLSPAGEDAGPSTPEERQNLVCQNNVPITA